MPILLTAALAAGFLGAFRFGPLAVMPIAGMAGLLAFILNVDFQQSMFLGAVGAILAVNIGYLAGAVFARFLTRSPKLRSLLPSRWLMR